MATFLRGWLTASNCTVCCSDRCAWRELAVCAIIEARRGVDKEAAALDEVYQLGVFNGGSMRFLDARLDKSLHFWGFDSFKGLPETSESPSQDRSDLHEWHSGDYSADPRARLRRSLGRNVTFVAGYFNTTLASDTVAAGMRPAAYIDVDVDVYESTRDSLDFLLRNQLVRPGTVVGYDDWWVLPCCENTTHGPLSCGEGRAHAEMARKYKIAFECVAGSCMLPDHETIGCQAHRYAWGAVFVVRADRNPSHGFRHSRAEIADFRINNQRCRTCVMRKALNRMRSVSRDVSRVARPPVLRRL